MDKDTREFIRDFIVVVIAAIVICTAGVFATRWAYDEDANECRGLGGTPVVWHNTTQCWPGGTK